MIRQTTLIVLVAALAAFGGWKILNTKPHEKKGGEKTEEKKSEEEEAIKVKLTPQALKNAKLKLEEAGAAKIKTTLPVYGKIATNEEAMAHVMARFSGIVKSVSKRLGDHVEKGDVLAIVESNESLRTYELKAEIAGTVIEKEVTLGEFVKDEKSLFVIADLNTVWGNLSVFRKDFAELKQGQPVEIHPNDGEETIQGTIAYISPFGAESTQTMLARVIIPNPKGNLRPGLFVTAEIQTGEVGAPVAVKLAAIQTLKEKIVVFVEDGEEFAAREVELGTKDGKFVEVLSGILPGEKYVSENSFILKAEIGKSEAKEE